ncbi:hypothetical protein [Yoonia sp. BS5-3]|uniref:Lipoprotein n=1 Tax=Yoonia phaeophyticola TaxID=3137369 RepID=A0ABZ3IE16_9RHOB
MKRLNKVFFGVIAALGCVIFVPPFNTFTSDMFPTFSEHARYPSPDGRQTAVLYIQSNYSAGAAFSSESGFRSAYVELIDAADNRLTPWHLRFTCRFQLGEFSNTWTETTMNPMQFVIINRQTGDTQCNF